MWTTYPWSEVFILPLWFTVGLDTLESEADLLRESAPSETELRRPDDFFFPLALLTPLADADAVHGGSSVFPIRPSISSRYPCKTQMYIQRKNSYLIFLPACCPLFYREWILFWMPNYEKFCRMTWMWSTYSHLKFFQLCPQLVKFVSVFGELSLNWHGVAERRVWFVHLLHLHEAVSCCRLLTDLWKKQIFFYVHRSCDNECSESQTLAFISSILCCNFFRLWLGGRSEKSSFSDFGMLLRGA